MSLVLLADCRALVKTSLSDAELQTVIDRVEADLTARLGAFQDGTGAVEVTETGNMAAVGMIFTRQAIASVVSLTIGSTLVPASSYTVHKSAGYINGVSAYYTGATPPSYTLVYRPTDIRPKLCSAIIDLVRLMVERTAMRFESVAGEYSYTAPEWDSEALRIIRRVRVGEV